jgi:hypothetical protein
MGILKRWFFSVKTENRFPGVGRAWKPFRNFLLANRAVFTDFKAN